MHEKEAQTYEAATGQLHRTKRGEIKMSLNKQLIKIQVIE